MANHIPKISYGSGPTVITFSFPPEGDPRGETAQAVNVTTRAANGQIQNSQLYQEELLKVKLSFVTKALADAFRTFFETWGSLKKTFTYFPHSDTSTDSADYTLEDDKIKFDRILPGAGSDFLYEFEFNLRRVK